MPSEVPLEETDEACTLSFVLDAKVSSAYLGSSGTLYDTWPNATQTAEFSADLGEYGELSGYGWFFTSLHNRQHESHRMMFNEYESALHYGYSFDLRKDVAWVVKAGWLWNPAIGYDEGHNSNWGISFVQRLENPYVVPFMNGLWMMQPTQRGRIRFGLSRAFDISESWSLRLSAESVWADKRRYRRLYGVSPQDDFMGGAFVTVVTGMTLSWHVAKDLDVYVQFRQYDLINGEARRVVRGRSSYYAKCDWPIAGIGVSYYF